MKPGVSAPAGTRTAPVSEENVSVCAPGAAAPAPAPAAHAAEGSPVSVTVSLPVSKSAFAAVLVLAPPARKAASGLVPPAPPLSGRPGRGSSQPPGTATAREAATFVGSICENAHKSSPSASGCAVPTTHATATSSGAVAAAGSTPVARRPATAAALHVPDERASAGLETLFNKRGAIDAALPGSTPVCPPDRKKGAPASVTPASSSSRVRSAFGGRERDTVGVCEGVGVVEAVEVAEEVEDAVAELVGDAGVEAEEDGEARALPVDGALAAPLPLGGTLRVEEALPVAPLVGAPVAPLLPDAESVFVGKGSAVVAGEAVAFLDAPAEALAGADATGEGESREPVGVAEALAGTLAPPLAEAALEALAGALAPPLAEAAREGAAEALGGGFAVVFAEAEATRVALGDADGHAVAKEEGDAVTPEVAVAARLGSLVAEAEAAADCVAEPNALAESERDCVEDPLSPRLAVPLADATLVREEVLDTEGERDTDKVPEEGPLAEGVASPEPDRVAFMLPEGDPVEVEDSVKHADTDHAGVKLAAPLSVCVLRAVGAPDALVVEVVLCEGEPEGERVPTDEALSRAAEALCVTDTPDDLELEKETKLVGEGRGEAESEGFDALERLDDGDSETEREARGEAEVVIDAEEVAAALAVRSLDAVDGAVPELRGDTLVVAVIVVVREAVGHVDAVMLRVAHAETVMESEDVFVTTEVPEGGAGEGVPERVPARTETVREGEPELLRDKAPETVSEGAVLPLREAEGQGLAVSTAEPVATEAVLGEEAEARKVREPEGVPVGPRPVSEGDAEAVITEAVGDVEGQTLAEGVRDTTGEALSEPDAVAPPEAVRTLAVTVPEGLIENVTEPEGEPDVDGLPVAVRGTEGDREEERHCEEDVEGVLHPEDFMLPLNVAEPV